MGEYVATLAILLTFSLPILAIWTKHRKDMMQMSLQATAEKAAQYATDNQQMADRVAVLERIVTDRGYDVATQIEALRDQRRVESELERLEDRSLV